jgi:exopolysaccharide biosynthesis predicted pyruvyltransferase EpsI
MVKAVAELRESAASLLDALGDPSDGITFLRSWGNLGDDLIYAGMRRLLRDTPHIEWDVRKLEQAPRTRTAILSGGASWCKPFHLIAEMFPAIEARYPRVIIFPTSFDTEEPVVRQVLSRTRAVVFAREPESYRQIQSLCEARLAHDTAFFFDFTPYQSGFHGGVLNAFRCDAEASGAPVPEVNRDVSLDCASLDEWLWTISRHDLIRTDRAHVIIAAAMMGRRVEYRSSCYHKVPSIVNFSVASSQVTRIDEGAFAAPLRPLRAFSAERR